VQIAKEYVDAGKIRYALLDFPLAMHPKAFDAAKAVRCAGDQGKFWEMHERLFANQQALEPWTGHAEAIGLKVSDFEACMKSDKHAEAIRADQKEGQKGGFTGTPSFLFAVTDPKDPKKVKGLSAMVGARPIEQFKIEIEKALAGN
jgi:protein-disulfide isomerase